jgi:hypothetical protein
MFQDYKIRTLTRKIYNHYYKNNIVSKMDTNWTYHQRYKTWLIPIIYRNKDSISNSTYSNKKHSLFLGIIIIWIGFWSH